VKVLGIDPGTAVLGYGVVESAPGRPGRLVECGVLETRPGDPLARRLRHIHEGVAGLIARHQPDAVAVEAAFHARNVRTTMVLSHARAVILLAADQAGLEIGEYSPTAVKKAITGRGAALKPQVALMLQQLLRLTTRPAPADASDGIAIALTHLLAAPARRRAAGVAAR
jgi:crossover junction endodeoxyribonuclease RuvC